MQQRTDEWFRARCGKITASRIADVMARTKSGYGASRRNYLAELLVERLTGVPTEHFVTREMMRGTELEPEARSLFELQHDVEVVETGFVVHPTMPYTGASPDGLVGEHGVVEIKCPNTATHIDTILTGKVPDRYYKQIQWNLECSGRQWAEFITYDPRVQDERLTLFSIHVPRNEEFLVTARHEVAAAEQELKQRLEQVSRVAQEVT